MKKLLLASFLCTHFCILKADDIDPIDKNQEILQEQNQEEEEQEIYDENRATQEAIYYRTVAPKRAERNRDYLLEDHPLEENPVR